MLALSQILGIARVELKFTLRRGIPIFGMLAVSGMLSLLIFWQGDQLSDLPPGAEAWRSSVSGAWPVVVLMAPIVLSIATILTVPADRDAGVQPVLFSQPVSGSAYLTGKTLGVLAGVLLSWAGGLALHMLAFRLFVGRFNLGFDLALLACAGLPLVTWIVAMAVLAGVWAPNRRAAILFGGLLGICDLVAWLVLFRLPAGQIPAWIDGGRVLDLIATLSFLDPIVSGLAGLAANRPFGFQDALLATAFAYLALLLFGLLTRWRLWARDNL